MNKKEEILKEIEESPTEQKDALINFLNICKTTNQWDAFTSCDYIKTGKYSYQSKRVWKFNNQKMYEAMKG